MIPSKTYRYSLREGFKGHEVWALQLNLNELQTNTTLTEDGDFGARTKDAVIRFQKACNLTQDGIVGIMTQKALARPSAVAATKTHRLPTNLLKSIAEGESGWVIGAVNWSVAGGVDCGYLQRRVLDGQSDSAFRNAFSAAIQFDLTAKTLREKKNLFTGRPGVETNKRGWELAVLHHNWPFAADKLSQGKSIYTDPKRDTQPADWVIAVGVSGVETPLEWANYYIESKTTYVPKNGWTR